MASRILWFKKHIESRRVDEWERTINFHSFFLISLPFIFIPFSRFLLGLSLIGGSSAGNDFDWAQSKIPESIMRSHKEDLDYIRILLDQTLTCRDCAKRHVIEGRVTGVEYCDCQGRKGASVYGQKSEGKSVLSQC